MKIVQINTTCGVGSTGKIAVGISQLLTQEQIENYILYSDKSSGYFLGISCADSKYVKVQSLKSHIFGNYGFNSKKATKKMISELERIHPDIVHLHNIHGHDCNLRMLFSYFKEKNIKLVWTFHDCWTFTAYCPYFDIAKCDKWKIGCPGCSQCKSFSWLLDRSTEMYNRKKELFSELDLTIVTPSQWLADLVKQSYLKDYPVRVINNGIDLSVFRPVSSDFRAKHNIPNEKYILLGVAFDWGIRKGLDVFVELSKRLNPEKYQIVLVGTDENIDKQLPKNIISIHRTQNQNELAEIYSAADVFVNPTREENFPTVNIESIACGTPVITFKTGGSPEIIDDTCGTVVEVDDVNELEKEIIRVCKDAPFSTDACRKRAETYDKDDKFQEYIDLYRRIYDGTAKS